MPERHSACEDSQAELDQAELLSYEIADYAAAILMVLEAHKKGRRSGQAARKKIFENAVWIRSSSGLLVDVTRSLLDTSKRQKGESQSNQAAGRIRITAVLWRNEPNLTESHWRSSNLAVP